jgi:acyl carrier protein
LVRHEEIREVVAVAREETPGDRRLVAYIVPTTANAPTASELKTFLRTSLPEFMVPSAIVVLDAFPLTPNGKIDRVALPAPGHARSENGFVPLGSPTEEVVGGVWSEVLGIEPIGAADDFFDLGGHSLLATRVISRLRKAFDVEIALRSIFAEPTVAGLAAAVDELVRAGSKSRGLVLTPVNRERHRVKGSSHAASVERGERG